MSDPGYDFFATGRPTPPPGAPAVPEPPVAAPAPLAPPPAAPAPAAYGAPAPARTFQMPNGTQVNQFGTPVGEVSAPTGPYAAPGVAAVPTAAPGMVSTWSGPPAPVPGHHAAAPGHRAAGPYAASSDRPPRNVVAVAVLAVVLGALGLLGTFGAMAAYSTLSSQIGAMGGTEFGSALMTAAVIAVVSLALVTVTLLVGGIATIVGKRWGGWILVAAFVIGILGQLQQLASVGVGMSQVIGLAIGVVLLLVLVTGEGLAWLQGRPSAR